MPPSRSLRHDKGLPVYPRSRGSRLHRDDTAQCLEPSRESSPDTDDGTYYGTRVGKDWTSSRITKRVGPTSLTLDTDTGRLHALVGGNDLRYYTKPADGDWKSTKLTSTWVVARPVIRLDPATGRLLVVYIATREDIGGGSVYVMTKP